MTFSQIHEQMYELISRRIDEDLSDSENQLLDDHLRTCSPCRRHSDEMNIAITQLRAFSPKRLSTDRRLKIDKNFEQDGYISTHLPLGQRISRFLVSLTKTPPRLAWAASSIVAIAGLGIVLYSGRAPDQTSRSATSATSQPTRGSDGSRESVYNHWRPRADEHKDRVAISGVRIRTISHKTGMQRELYDGAVIWEGDQIYIKIKDDYPNEIYLSATVIASVGGPSLLLTEQERVLPGKELGPFTITGHLGAQSLILVATKRITDTRIAINECLSAQRNGLCHTVRFELAAREP